MRKTIVSGALALAALAAGAFGVGAESLSNFESQYKLPERHWHFEGPFGTYDRAAAQRGYQVYATVCASCHSLELVAYRNLMDLAEAGIVSRAELGDHVWRYEVRREGHEHSAEHPHFVCVDCGEVTCLTETSVDITPTPGTKKSSIGSLTEVLLKGHCGKCS